ncbi:TIR domain-containing protein, partial [bacterium]|nr:TIR domain-containing protein [bacterium]
DILRSLSIVDNTKVTAYYYPTPKDERHKDCEFQHDIMITPIPFEMWTSVGRFVIRLSHRPGSLHRIAKFLAQKNVSILNAECTRSGHRYATWNVLAWIQNPSGDKTKKLGNANTEQKIQADNLIDSLKDLADEIEEKSKKDCLFENSEFTEPQKLVEYFPNKNDPHLPLWYFHRNALEREAAIEQGDRGLDNINDLNTFDMMCQAGKLKPAEGDFDYILAQMGEDVSKAKICVIAEMDTKSYIIRVFLIPTSKQKSHFEMRVPYRRRGPKISSAGFLATITEKLAPQYNLWRVYNHTGINSRNRETGELVMYVEDRKQDIDQRKYQDVFSDARELFQYENQDLPKPLDHISLGKIPITPIQEVLRLEMEAEREEQQIFPYDVFISFAKKDEKIAEEIYKALKKQGFEPFMYNKRMRGGDPFSPIIRNAIINSREMCIVYTNNTPKSLWVSTEWGAAWVLDRHIVPLLLPDTDVTILPPRLRERAFLRYPGDLVKYIEEVSHRRQESQEYY